MSIASSSSKRHFEVGVLCAPRDVAQAEFEGEATLEHPFARRLRDKARKEPLEDDPLAHARYARRVALPLLDPSFERGAKGLVGRVLHRVSSAI